ncbi:hypothetical protein GJ744_011590 [Endocarpon pusillum]|uniref:Uncharacterized protein n=1 Tax=Endocarpon pusillum TaxID=364733 RepID=A0A8H7ACF0_9EURO|nr:hypothetical protein GJ744_011590 [Endocarpon pusillum]
MEMRVPTSILSPPSMPAAGLESDRHDRGTYPYTIHHTPDGWLGRTNNEAAPSDGLPFPCGV